VEFDLVLRGGLKHFFQRAVCSRSGEWIPHFADPALMWEVLALATTFAGNLTIIGSVANMIVVESAREHLEIGFWDYARFGIPITILTTVAGTFVLLAFH
jgi:Na+/H+ antiporter NhaD/arsenite permease-like protein